MSEEKRMAVSLKLEEAAITALSIYFLSLHNLGIPVWVWVMLFFSPDLSMIGYVINTRVGAITYNLVHHRGVAIIVIGVGMYFQNEVCIAAGLVLLGHSSFDRMMGYGLKFKDDFKHTSLGWIGKSGE